MTTVLQAPQNGRNQASPSERSESSLERLDRNTTELLNGLRVAGTGIQVLFAFLLVLPFNTGWKRVSTFDRWDYFISLLCIATAAVLLIAPSIHHRMLFRRGQKAYIVTVGTRLAITAVAFLSVGMTGILVLIANVVFGTAAAIVVGVFAGAFIGGVWFALPLAQRRDCEIDPVIPG